MSNSEISVSLNNVSKHYQLGQINYGTLYNSFQSYWARVRGRTDPNQKVGYSAENVKRDLWALKNINLEISRGESIGLIGRNGAGKSTLLKILSRITSPTSGRIEIYGRLSSLLEVGTGFHPEMTGSENILMNGIILGLTKKEILNKKEQIIEFSGLSRFIDTPVKRYSSGMYVKLAFAVAAHLDPDIMIVDEVLAVGDYEFQKKCIDSMESSSKQDGRTLLFVSHNLSLISRLCKRSVLLDAGEIMFDGNTQDALNKYIDLHRKKQETGINELERSGTGIARLKNIELRPSAGKAGDLIFIDDNILIICDISVEKNITDLVLGIFITDIYGSEIASCYNTDATGKPTSIGQGSYRVNCTLLRPQFLPGKFNISVALAHQSGADIDFVRGVVSFESTGICRNGGGGYLWDTVHGFTRLDAKYEIL